MASECPTDEFSLLTSSEIFEAGAPIKFGRADRRSSNHLLETVAQLLPPDQERIHAAASLKRKRQNIPGSNSGHNAKIPKNSSQEFCQEPTRFDDNEFLKPPGNAMVEKCIASFIDRTRYSALHTRVCMVCAREVGVEEAVDKFVHQIPNNELLVPINKHPAHECTLGLLLHPMAISTTTLGPEGAVCHKCISNLEKGHLPRLALANDMWIGGIPLELVVLTLPEQILIARHFPSAHIVKLYPQKKGARSGNCALCGNVSTYRLNTDEIAEMVQGEMMPNPACVLASTIGVTIIGPKNVSKKTMPDFLWVRRNNVRRALVWLKANNPLYSDIVISEDRLAEILEFSVPEVILSLSRYSDNIKELEREHVGYVPEDGDFENTQEPGANTRLGNFEDYVSGTTGM